MISKQLILSFFIFGILTALYIFEIVEFSTSIVICMFVFWICVIVFDLHTTFQRKEFLQNESNPILSYLLEKTTIRKTIPLYILFQVMFIMLLPIICFWQIDFVFSGIFAVFAGTIHVFAGISNQKMMKDSDNKNLILLYNQEK